MPGRIGYAHAVHDPRDTQPDLEGQTAAPSNDASTLALVLEGRTIPLALGELLLGRAPTCDVAVDEARVSRTHAKIVVTENAVTLRDLDSTNGVRVNGARIACPTPLREGDIIGIGSIEISIVAIRAGNRGRGLLSSAEQPESPASRQATAAVSHSRAAPVQSTSVFDASETLTDQLPATPRMDDPERPLASDLRQLLEFARDGRGIAAGKVTEACSQALKAAELTGDGKWFDYVIELHFVLKRPLDNSLVEKVSTLWHRRIGFDRASFEKYQAMLRTQERAMSLADRVLCMKVLAFDPKR